MRWMEDVERDLWEMKVKRWRQKAVDREEWVFVIRETEAVRGPCSQGVSEYLFHPFQANDGIVPYMKPPPPHTHTHIHLSHIIFFTFRTSQRFIVLSRLPTTGINDHSTSSQTNCLTVHETAWSGKHLLSSTLHKEINAGNFLCLCRIDWTSLEKIISGIYMCIYVYIYIYIYTGCFTTLGHNCRRWFPRSLWSKKFI